MTDPDCERCAGVGVVPVVTSDGLGDDPCPDCCDRDRCDPIPGQTDIFGGEVEP